LVSFRDDEGPDDRQDEEHLPGPLQKLLDELSHDLEEQLGDGIALPALIVLDRAGRQLGKDLLFLEGELASEDEVLAAVIEDRFGPEAALIGFVRHNEDPPRILVWDSSRSWVGHRRPELRGRKVLGWKDDWPKAL
jgi:hypothetical protein